MGPDARRIFFAGVKGDMYTSPSLNVLLRKCARPPVALGRVAQTIVAARLLSSVGEHLAGLLQEANLLVTLHLVTDACCAPFLSSDQCMTLE